MKIFFTVLVFVFFLCVSFPVKAGVGMGEWRNKTPGNHTIDNWSGKGTLLYLSYDKKLDSLEKWYFYKGFIVGKQTGHYFIVNEQSLNVETLKDEKEWLRRVSEQKLEPLLWTRWYSDQWYYLDDLGYIAFMFFPITILLVLFYGLFLIMAIKKEKLNPKKPTTRMLIVLTIAPFVFCLLEWFPQSV